MKKTIPIQVDNTKAQMRKGILEFCILLVISKGKTYASEILKQLKEADLIVVEGTMYPLLTRLKNAGLLEYDWEESSGGPPRKYYSLTPQGIVFLDELSKTWGSLDRSINTLLKKYR